MTYQDQFNRWMENASEDLDLTEELKSIADNAPQVADRFYRGLEFGTGGLRGVLGAGPNRMNIYTVRRATQGLADYINASDLMNAVAIAYDSRMKGELFAREAARVLAANGIGVWLYPRLEPTPALSWAVRYLGCGAGICVTASHNPAQYNGYKVYGPDGCQITPKAAEKILGAIERLDYFTDVQLADFQREQDRGMIRAIPDRCLDAFVDAVLALRPGSDVSRLKLVYTPLNGSGLECVKKLLEKMGVADVTVVPSQATPDGNFPTCPYPNPEIREAMEEGLRLCAEIRPDLLLGTDPDCDRMGAAVPDGQGGYRLISGNEMGVLLLDYLCRTRIAQGDMPERPVAVTTIVSTDMADPIAREYGVELRRTLTGFKYIGEQIGLLEAAGESERFIFGFEESYGYLSGSHVRDKDAVNAVMLACECAAWYRERGMTLLDALNTLYQKYGYYQNALITKQFEGEDGMAAMKALIASLRAAPPSEIAGRMVTEVVDYLRGLAGLVPADVLEFRLSGGGKFIVRPSGTEPKLKVYLSVRGVCEDEAQGELERLSAAVRRLMM